MSSILQHALQINRRGEIAGFKSHDGNLEVPSNHVSYSLAHQLSEVVITTKKMQVSMPQESTHPARVVAGFLRHGLSFELVVDD